MMLRHHAELTRALSRVCLSFTAQHVPEQVEEKRYINKTDSSTSNRKPEAKWDFCAALLPRYLPGLHLSGSLCHSMHLSLLLCTGDKGHTPPPGKPSTSCPSRKELPGLQHDLHPRRHNARIERSKMLYLLCKITVLARADQEDNFLEAD